VGHRRDAPGSPPHGDHAAARVLRRVSGIGGRLPSTISAEQAGFPFRQLAREEGVVFPDHFDHDWRAGSAERVYSAIDALESGITEIHVQPAIDTPEVRALGPDTQGWIDDLALVTGEELRERLAASGATLIGYRELREAMRTDFPVS
jgi:chitin disaccharide deacetylase